MARRSGALLALACLLLTDALRPHCGSVRSTRRALRAEAAPSPVVRGFLKAVGACALGAQIVAAPAYALVGSAPAAPGAAPVAAAAAAAPSPAADGRALVEEAWDLLDKYYYDGAARKAETWTAARAKYGSAAEQKPRAASDFRAKALEALGADRYTRILTPRDYEAVARFDILGVGLILSPGPDGRARVVSPPLPGSSAAKSKLVRQGDVVDALNGVKTSGKSSFDILDVIAKAENPREATFEISRDGGAPTTVVLARTVNEVADPVSQTAYDAKSELGYVRLREFNARVAPRLAEALGDLEGKGATRFIVDVRGNPGGAFQAAVSAASLFLPPGSPVVTVVERAEDGSGGPAERKETFRAAKPAAGLTRRPKGVEVWIDSGSASASEIFAGAMRDNCAAALVGDTSYGKGKIQAVFGLADDAGLVVTVAQYLTPKGTAIQGVGVHPDANLGGIPFGPLPLPGAAAFDATVADAGATCARE